MVQKNALWIAATGLAYILGAATAVLVMRERIDRKYRKIADEEIESVKEAFERKNAADIADQILKKTEQKLNEVLLTGSDGPIPHDETSEDAVYIRPDEFGNDEDYDVITITYYESNFVFTDDMDEPIPDGEWEDMLGPNVAKQFGDYEPDRVCVRNDKRRAYYEVLLEKGEFLE